MNAFPNGPPFFHSLSPPPQQQQRHPWQQQEARRKLNSTITTTFAEPQPLAMPFCSQTTFLPSPQNLRIPPETPILRTTSDHQKKNCVCHSLSLCLSVSLREKKSDRGGEKKVQDSEEEEEEEEAEGAKLVTKKGEEPKEGTRSVASRHQIGCHLR
jgi:hypothetical protein